MPDQMPEVVFDLEELMSEVSRSFTTASSKLAKAQQGNTGPVVYHMPKMTATVELSLSYQKNRLRGLFAKQKTDRAMKTTLSFDVVAVPNPNSKR